MKKLAALLFILLLPGLVDANRVHVTVGSGGLIIHNYSTINLDRPGIVVFTPSDEMCSANPELNCDEPGRVFFLDTVGQEQRLTDYLESFFERHDGLSLIEEATLEEIASAYHVESVITHYAGEGIVLQAGTDTSIGNVDYNGPDFVSSQVYMYHGTDTTQAGYHHISLNVVHHQGSTCFGCSDRPTTESWLNNNSNGLLEPREHNVPLNFYRPNSGNWDTTKYALVDASNEYNDYYPNAEQNFQQAQQLLSDIEGLNGELEQAATSNKDSAERLLSVSDDLSSHNLSLDKHFRDSKNTVKDLRLESLKDKVSSGYFDLSSSHALSQNILNRNNQINLGLQASINSINESSSNLTNIQAQLDQLGSNLSLAQISIAESASTDYNRANDQADPEKYLDPTLPDQPNPLPNTGPNTAPKPPIGSQILTGLDNPNYQKLSEAIDYYHGAAEQVIESGDQGAIYTHQLAGVGLMMADSAYSENKQVEGDDYLSTSIKLVDAALDFVPGVSLVKDAVTILTGKNPITGEIVSDTERTLMLASLFVPSAISGSAKAITKAATAFKKSADNGDAVSQNMLDVIGNSDAKMAKYSNGPCAGGLAKANHSKSKKSWFTALAFTILNFVVPTTHAVQDNPCGLGAITDNVLEKNNIAPDEFSPGTTGNWNPELNTPNPNTIFRFKDGSYQTDGMGRTVLAEFSDLKYNPADRNHYQQRIAGGDYRKDSDVGGHIIGSQFAGAGEGINIVAMDKILNGNSVGGGTYGRLEMSWKSEIEAGNKVGVSIRPKYSGSSLRPDYFDIVEDINGVQRDIRIHNRPGG